MASLGKNDYICVFVYFWQCSSKFIWNLKALWASLQSRRVSDSQEGLCFGYEADNVVETSQVPKSGPELQILNSRPACCIAPRCSGMSIVSAQRRWMACKQTMCCLRLSFQACEICEKEFKASYGPSSFPNFLLVISLWLDSCLICICF